MHHTRIALYDIKSGSFDEIVSQAKAGLVPLYKSSPGFLNLGVAKIDKAAFVSLSTWETREQADKASVMAADWVRTNGREQYALRENFVGDLAIETDTRQAVGTVR
jgi:heme-degrading monooxygenase HmoA